MAGNIIGEPIKEIVGEQVDLRQKIQGAGYNESSIKRSPAVLNFLNNKNAWIKLASGTSIEQTEEGKQRLRDLAKFETQNYFTEPDIDSLLGKNLAKNYILFNTMQSLTQGAELTTTGEGADAVTTQTRAATYEKRSGIRTTNTWNGSNTKMYGGMGGNSRGLQPIPGITNIKVESVNRGSIRKATVTLRAFNKFQFGIIEILYLRLGYLMMLEWGWDKYIDSIDENNNPIIKNTESTIIENQWFKDKSFSQREMLQQINTFVDRYKGNYQGFFGKVNNFSWSLNADNTYDITINLITLGSIIESINAVVPTKSLSKKELEKKVQELRKIYKIGGDDGDELEDDEEDNKVITNLGSDRISSYIAQNITKFFEFKLDTEDDNYYYFPNAVNGTDATDGNDSVEDNQAKIPTTSNFYIRLGELLKVIEDNVVFKVINGDNEIKESSISFDTSEETNRISYEPNLIPLDPSICIFKPAYTEELGVIGKIGVPTFPGLKDFVVEKQNVYYGKLMNVYLNLNFVADVLSSNKNEKNELDLYSFVQKLADGISRCMGNVPDLSVSIKNDIDIYFLDENPITGYDFVYPSKNQEVEFNIIGYTPTKGSTFIKDFNFQTKITPQLMTQISVGATAAGSEQNSLNAVGYTSWNRGLKNRFEERYLSDPSEYGGPSKEEKYFNNIYENDFKVNSSFSFPFGSYRWSYKGITKYYGTDETSRFSSNETNFEKDSLKDLVKASILQIDEDAKGKNRTYLNEGEKLNDYPTYLLDAFGGTGINKVEVKTAGLGASFGVIGLLASEGTARIALNAVRNAAGVRSGSIFEGEGIDTKFVDQKVSPADALYWYSSDNSDFLERGYNSFKQYKSYLDQLQYEREKVVSGATGFIPVTLGLTFDGLGGIKIYNRIKINQTALPASYPSALKFIIDGVNHDVNGNLWETNITTISQPNTSKAPSRRMIKSTNNSTSSNQQNNVQQPAIEEFSGPEDQTVSLLKKISLKAPTSNGLMYYPQSTPKIQLVLHHTAVLGASVENIINSWSRNSNHVSTHFIINRDGDYDQLFPLKYWGNHIGSKKSGNRYLQKSTISIELEGAGFLKYINNTGRNPNGTFRDTAQFKQGSRTFTYKQLQGGINEPPVARPVKMLSDGSLKMEKEYRGYEYYHTYTTPQLKVLEKVLRQIKNEYPNIAIGSNYSGENTFSEQFPKGKLTSKDAFNFNSGTFSHNSYRTDKRDIFPQKELIELLQKFN